MSFNLVATYRANPGVAEDLAVHLESMIGPTRAEQGCEVYLVLRSKDEPGTFVLVESYRAEEDFEAHKASSHFQAHIVNGAWELLESRSVVFAEELGG